MEDRDRAFEAIGRFFSELGWVDSLALGALLAFLIRGVIKGFVWQAVGVVGFLGGIVVGRSVGPELAPTLQRMFPILVEQEQLGEVIAFFAVFVVVLSVAYLLGRLLHGLIDRLHLGSYDRLLGCAFGAVQAIALIVMSVSFLSLFEAVQPTLAKSRAGQFSGTVVEEAGPLFPEELKDYLRELGALVQSGGGADDELPSTESVEGELGVDTTEVTVTDADEHP